MGALNNLYVSSSFQGLLKLTDSATGLTNTLQTVEAGDGSDSPLQISLTQVNISGSFTVNNLPITGSTSGTAGTSGTSGTSGSDGSSGTSGTSGSSGSSGTSGSNGSSGTSGTSGINGTSGTSGFNGSSGTSGTAGSSGSSGTSGSAGSSGTSGTSGSSGSSGTSGSSGSSGTTGTSGTSGTSGDSIFSQTGSFYATTNDIQITGSLIVTGGITGSISNAVTASIANDLIVIGKCNNPGGLTRGTIVRIIGADGDNPLFDSASWTDDFNSANTLGMLSENVANNGFANIVVQGKIIGINTQGMNAGDLLYLSSSGQYTTSSVPAPFHEVRLGQVLRANLNNGSAYITIDNGYELTELHDVDITNPVVGDLLVYRSGSYGQWVNENGAELGFATTGSNSFVGNQNITGSLSVSQTSTLNDLIISGNLVGNAVNNGFIKIKTEAYESGSLQFENYATASAPISQSNLMFGSGGPHIGSSTGRYIISGSNNIILNPLRLDTTSAGTFGYIQGDRNIINNIPVITTSSFLNATYFGNVNNIMNGLVTIDAPSTGALVSPSYVNALNGNFIGQNIILRHKSGSFSVQQNTLQGAINSFATSSLLQPSGSVQGPTISANIHAGGSTNLLHTSSSILYNNNFSNTATLNVRNEATHPASANASGSVQVINNIFNGIGTTTVFFSGSGVVGTKVVTGNISIGSNNELNVINSGSSNGTLSNTAILGQGLIVSGNLSTTNSGGSTFVGRWNATGSNQETLSETVFVVGTGTAANARRNALRIDNSGNSNFTGSVNVSGSLTVNGQSVVTGSVSVDRNGLITTGSLSSNVQAITGSLIISGSEPIDLIVTGGARVTSNDGTYNSSILPQTIQVSTQNTPNVGANLNVFGSTGSNANFYLGVYDEPNFTTDVEYNIVVDSNGINFNDWDNGSTFSYLPWMTIGPNTGNNPIPQMKRGLGVTGSLRVTGSLQVNGVTVDGNRNGLITTGSNTFPDQSITGSITINGGSPTSNALVISGSMLIQSGGTINNMNFWRGPGDIGQNIGLGFNTLTNVSGAIGLTAIGASALAATTTGGNNTAIGVTSMLSNTTGQNNTAIGGSSLQANVSGSNNIAIGNSALSSNASNQNTAIGSTALQNNTTGQDNTAIGYQALNQNTSGLANMAIGTQTLVSNVTGSRNVAIGNAALYYNVNDDNTAIGTGVLFNNYGGRYNIGIGTDALSENTSGESNIAIGYVADKNRTEGVGNIAIGERTFWNLGSGSYNIAIGYNAGYNIGNDDKQFYVAHKDFGSLNGDRSGSLMWGQMADAASGQTLQINAATSVYGSLRVTGSAVITGSVNGNVQSLSISSNTASLNLNNGNFFTLQLVSGSNTRIEPSNIKPGQTINILLNTTGSGTVSFPSSVKQVSGSSYVPTTTTGVDIVTLVSFDSSSLYLANVKNLI